MTEVVHETHTAEQIRIAQMKKLKLKVIAVDSCVQFGKFCQTVQAQQVYLEYILIQKQESEPLSVGSLDQQQQRSVNYKEKLSFTLVIWWWLQSPLLCNISQPLLKHT